MSTMRTLALFAAATGIVQAGSIIPTRDHEARGLTARGESPLYGQCGGKNWSGTTNCVAGATCFAKEEYYHQCVPATSSAAAPATAAASTSASAPAAGGGGGGGTVPLYGQCGAGKGAWTGPTGCAEGTCQAIQDYYSCLPGGSGASSGSGSSSGVAASDANATQKPTVSGGGGGGSVALYGQCGAGKGDWTGPTTCAEGTCKAIQEYYSQCLPGSVGTDAAAALPSSSAPAPPAAPASGGGSVALYGQCGAGKGDWTGPTSCASGTCQAIQEYYSQCLPGTAPSSGGDSGAAPAGPAQSLYAQCGGKDYKGPTTCEAGAECDMKDDTYSQCLPSGPKSQLYQQCGGDNFSGAKTCVVGSTCKQLNQWYWQCFPASAAAKKRDVPSKRDIIQEIAKAFGFGANATSANGTLANATGVVAPIAPPAAVAPSKLAAAPQAPEVAPAAAIPTAVLLPMASTPALAPAPKATTARMYGQCGGIGFKGPTKCPEGFACMAQSSNAYYSQCLPGTLPANDGRAGAKAPVEQAAYAQCGGLGYKGSTLCTAGTACTAQAGNVYFSQCIPYAQPAPAPQNSAAQAPAPVSDSSVVAASAPTSAPSVAVPSVAAAPAVASTPAPAPVAMKRDGDAPPAAVYSQCGGTGWVGSTTCEEGSTCIAQPNNAFYSQCMPTLVETTEVNGVETKTAVVPHWGQCGGQGWQGPTTCAKDSKCMSQSNNAFYAQCIPSFAANSRRNLINAKTSLVFNPETEGQDVPAAPAPAPKEVDEAPGPAPKEIDDAPAPAPKKVEDVPEETPSFEPARLDGTVPVEPRPSVSASSSTTSALEPVQTLFGQCGGQGYEGSTNCGDDAKCYRQDNFYFQCLPLAQQNFAQCGGDNYNGPTACSSGVCIEIRRGYKQCQPATQRRGLIDADTSLLINPASAPGPAPKAEPAPEPAISETGPISDAPETAQVDDSTPTAPDETPESAPSAELDSATQQVYGQCGGSGYSGPTKCEDGSKCYQQRNGNDYAQCLPTVQQVYGQCGGKNYAGPTACEQGSRCRAIRLGYSQCIPTKRRRDGSSDYPAASAPSNAQNISIGMSPPSPPSNVSQESAPVPEPQVVQAKPQVDPAPVQAESQVTQPASKVAAAPISAPAPEVAQAAPQPQVAQPAPQPQAVQPAPQQQVAQAAPQVQPAPPTRPSYEVEDTKIPYNPTMDSLVKAPLALLGQTSRVYAACGGMGFQGNTVCEAGSKCYTQNAYYSQCLPLVVATYQQCGGGSYFGSHECAAGAECMKIRPDYFQCLPPSAKIRRAMEDPLKMLGSSLIKTQGMFGQCGGTGWGGPKLCQPGAKCVASGSFYSQCLPDDSPIGKVASKLNGGLKPPKLTLPDLAPKPAAPAAGAAAPAAGGAPPAAAAPAR